MINFHPHSVWNDQFLRILWNSLLVWNVQYMLLSDSIPLAAPSFNKSFINNLQSNAPNKHIMWTFHLGVVKSYVLVLSSYCMFYLQSAVSLWLSGFSLSLSIVHLLHYYSEYFFLQINQIKSDSWSSYKIKHKRFHTEKSWASNQHKNDFWRIMRHQRPLYQINKCMWSTEFQ